MKAPVQEYVVILAQLERDFKWGQLADPQSVTTAKANLATDFVVSRVMRWSHFEFSSYDQVIVHF